MSLATCETISIRAQFNKDGSSVKLSNVELDKAFANRGEQNAATVELCECPVGYEGSFIKNIFYLFSSVQDLPARNAPTDTTVEKAFISVNAFRAIATGTLRPVTNILAHVL